MGAITDHRPVRADQEELDKLRQFSEAIQQYRGHNQGPSVLMDDNNHIEIPPPLFAVLCEAVEVLLAGGAVAILPYHQELTTQEAADYLAVSRPHLIKLLSEEDIPYHRVGAHRRIRLSDLEEYRRRRDAQRRATLDEMTREAYELGFYDVDDHQPR